VLKNAVPEKSGYSEMLRVYLKKNFNKKSRNFGNVENFLTL